MRTLVNKTKLPFFMLLAWVLPMAVSAGAVSGGLKKAGGTSGLRGLYKNDDLGDFAAGFVSQAVGLIGVLFMLMIVFSGVMWMTAGGNEERITKAKKTITGAAIGLLVVFGSYMIVRTIYDFYYITDNDQVGLSEETPTE